jgi:hypothetical protein
MEHHESSPAAGDNHAADGPAGLEPDPGPESPVPFEVLIGKAVAAELGPAVGSMLSQVVNLFPQMLPQLVAQGVAQALGQMRVRTARVCCECLLVRLRWEAAHRDELEAVISAAERVTGAPRTDPRVLEAAIQLLPPGMQPGSGSPAQMPAVSDAVTFAGGSEVCPAHVPGVPGAQGKRGFLLPPPGMNVHMAVRLLSGAPA